MHKAGRIRVLATSDGSARNSCPTCRPSARPVSTSQATGWYGIFAPAKTPPETIERLNKVIVAAVQSPDVKERLLAFGLQPTGTSAAEFVRNPESGLGALGAGREGVRLQAAGIGQSCVTPYSISRMASP